MDEEEYLERSMRAFVERMLVGIDQRARPGVRRAILRFIADLHRDNDLPVPEWLLREL